MLGGRQVHADAGCRHLAVDAPCAQAAQQIDTGPAARIEMLAPEGKMRGLVTSPLSIAIFSPNTGPPISRVSATIWLTHASVACQWKSMRPGITDRPPQSVTSASCGPVSVAVILQRCREQPIFGLRQAFLRALWPFSEGHVGLGPAGRTPHR